ncbi:MAG: chemotaxis protein CheB [Rhodoferax sp.]
MTEKYVGGVTLFPIVGIGAPAGGLEAFEAFFRACPADTSMGFVLVPHLDPGHVSLLTEILQRCTAMPVAQALDQVTVAPNLDFEDIFQAKDTSLHTSQKIYTNQSLTNFWNFFQKCPQNPI